MEFEPFPKLARLSRRVIISEKLDGTNACVAVVELDGHASDDAKCLHQADGLALFAGSRTRWITPDDDNYGFAKWVQENREELLKLGPGRHFGEWWGRGVQRGYSLTEKRFSLFNTERWGDAATRPACCHVVPVLYDGIFDTNPLRGVMARLEKHGSVAAPGFMQPEGVVIYHTAAGVSFKKTLVKDESPKGIA